MPRKVPLKVAKPKKPKDDTKKKERMARKDRLCTSPYDIILGKVDIEYSQIPDYM